MGHDKVRGEALRWLCCWLSASSSTLFSSDYEKVYVVFLFFSLPRNQNGSLDRFFQFLTKIEGKNSAPATWATSLTEAKAGALAVKVVKAIAMATWLAFPWEATEATLCLFWFLLTLMVHLVLLALTAKRGILFAAHTFILVSFFLNLLARLSLVCRRAPMYSQLLDYSTAPLTLSPASICLSRSIFVDIILRVDFAC